MKNMCPMMIMTMLRKVPPCQETSIEFDFPEETGVQESIGKGYQGVSQESQSEHYRHGRKVGKTRSKAERANQGEKKDSTGN